MISYIQIKSELFITTPRTEITANLIRSFTERTDLVFQYGSINIPPEIQRRYPGLEINVQRIDDENNLIISYPPKHTFRCIKDEFSMMFEGSKALMPFGPNSEIFVYPDDKSELTIVLRTGYRVQNHQ